jgi:hypothetical protein
LSSWINHEGDPDSFELFLIDNTTPETNVFFGSFGVVDGFGDVLSHMDFVRNELTNLNGKGLFAIDGFNPEGLIDF